MPNNWARYCVSQPHELPLFYAVDHLFALLPRGTFILVRGRRVLRACARNFHHRKSSIASWIQTTLSVGESGIVDVSLGGRNVQHIWRGTANASASFLAGFMWLISQRYVAGINQSCRQVFAHADYSVVGRDNRPNRTTLQLFIPRLVGRNVLRIFNGTARNRDVRVTVLLALNQLVM